MATRILFDPRVDLPDGTTGSSPVIVEATPTGIRADGSVFVLPTTLSFTISTPADQLLLAAPAASWGWNLAVRRAGAMLYGASQAGSVLARRTVTWTDAASVTWADLTDLDPATLEPTPAASASWTATQELAQAAKDAVDALKAGAPGALDTFLELATQLQADESGAAALAALVGTKAPLASPALTGTPTIGGTPVAKTTDISSAVAAVTLAGLGGVTSAQVAATYLPKWAANTPYTAGQQVVNPSGQTVQANTTFTSGASYSATNWTIVGSQVLVQDSTDDTGILVIAAAAPGGGLLTPVPGDSAYQVWLNAGNTGTVSQYLASLKGQDGAAGTEYTPSAAASWSGAVDLSSYTAPACIRATLTGNVTSITLPTPASTVSYPIMLVLTQDGTGGRTVAWPVAPLSASGIDPVLTTTPGGTDLVHLLWTGAGWVLIGGAMALA